MSIGEMPPAVPADIQNKVTPVREELYQTLQLASIFALITVALHVAVNLRAQHVGYGLFDDELYYIVCGRHLAWGYVDQPPIVALAARFTELLFGWHSLALFRLLPSLAGGLEVAGTGLLVREMGGRRTAQMIAMLCVLASPVVLGIDAILSMNCFEPLFWMGTAYAVLRVVRGDSARWWIVAGVAAGLGIENKWNIAFFLFAMLAALLLTSARKTLANRWFAVCVGLILLLALPNLLWQIHRDWPTLVWLQNGRTHGKSVVLGPVTFIWDQVFLVGPISSLVWVGGLVWLLTARAARGLRWIGVLYVLYLPCMMALHADDYYLAPVYPIMFAAGGLAWDRWLVVGRVRKFAVPIYVSLILAYGIVAILIAQPVLTPAEYVRFNEKTHLQPREYDTAASAPQPELLANMTGWKDMADKLAEAYWALSPADRRKAGILVSNYSEASAVTVYRPDVPAAISGNQNYWYWGPRGHDGSVMIVFGEKRETLEKEFASVTEVARTTNPWGQPYEAGPVYLCRGAKQDLRAAWPSLKNWY